MVYRYKSRLKGIGSGWNRTPSQIVELMKSGEVEFRENGQWRQAEKVSDTSFKAKAI